jgi:hypothetical protein
MRGEETRTGHSPHSDTGQIHISGSIPIQPRKGLLMSYFWLPIVRCYRSILGYHC